VGLTTAHRVLQRCSPGVRIRVADCPPDASVEGAAVRRHVRGCACRAEMHDGNGTGPPGSGQSAAGLPVVGGPPAQAGDGLPEQAAVPGLPLSPLAGADLPEWLRDVAELASDWFWQTDAELRYVWLSEDVERITGVSRAWFYGKTCVEIAGPSNDPRALAEHWQRLLRREPYRDFEFEVAGPNGSVWVRSNGRPLFDAKGRFLGYCGTGRDITGLKLAELSLRESERLYRQLVELLPDAVVVHRDGIIRFANRGAAELLGRPEPVELVGTHVLDHVHPEDRVRVVERWRELVGSGRVPPAEMRLLRADGTIVHVETRAARTVWAGGHGVLVTARDIGERKAAERRLAWLAHHDVLTGLPNRRRLAEALEAAMRPGAGPVAVFLLDLDGFKHVNDTLGHMRGDALLAAVAERLRAAVRPGDLVCRLGGDEFAVLAPGIVRPAHARALARRLAAALEPAVEAEGASCYVGGSIGYALYPAHARTPEELLAAADLALYAAKQERCGLRGFEPAMRERAERRRALEGRLRARLEDGSLEVHYQPLVELGTGRVCGVEALVRWPDGPQGRIPPDVFVALAEECGLAPKITRLVLEQAAAELPQLERAWGCPLRLAVNLAPEELAIEDAARRLGRLIREFGLDPTRLEFEITERTLLRDAEVVSANLRALGELGVRFAIDDFGTGYSSLVYLKRIPVSRLKLDRTFVAGLPDDPEDRAIVRAVTSLAAAFDLELLAEGVETEAQRAFLLQAGCREAQGWLFAPAMPAGELCRWLARHAAFAALTPAG